MRTAGRGVRRGRCHRQTHRRGQAREYRREQVRAFGDALGSVLPDVEPVVREVDVDAGEKGLPGKELEGRRRDVLGSVSTGRKDTILRVPHPCPSPDSLTCPTTVGGQGSRRARIPRLISGDTIDALLIRSEH